MKLSACLVIHEEEKILGRCLESIKNVVDEIVVIHDGSCHDNSLEIAQKFGAKIFTRPYIGEAEYHRPFSFENAKGDWIFQIDADEFLSEGAKKEIPKLIKSKETDAYSFLWPYPQNGGYIKRGPFAKTLKQCLFRKEKLFMIGISHEYPKTNGVLSKRLDLLLEHKPLYDNFTNEAFEKKWMDWARLQAKQIKDFKKAPTFNITEEVKKKNTSHYMSMCKHPIYSAIRESVKFLLIYLSRGLLWAGRRSWKIAYFELSYLWLVRLNLWKLNNGERL